MKSLARVFSIALLLISISVSAGEIKNVKVYPASFNPSIGQKMQISLSLPCKGMFKLEILDRDKVSHTPIKRRCNTRTGQCVDFPVDPTFTMHWDDEPTDECIKYCAILHEWIHYNDRRHYGFYWSDSYVNRFQEYPIRLEQIRCLVSFL